MDQKPGIEDRLDALTESVQLLLLDSQEHTRKFERMDERFDRIDERFERIENRIGGVENRLGSVENRLTGVESSVESLTTLVAVSFTSLARSLEVSKKANDDELMALRKHTDAGFDRLAATMNQLGQVMIAHEKRIARLEGESAA